ncbi:hypothetical protein FHU33_4358 [Blastococcus colisei]|uniref:Uncharacterized protein n=1 Tax=Blastococcus colisei TaxID=1564162 RepID=A0A543P0Q7_9ACTN|nr:hypothetical protein [Blastococcus colisei]TQN37694.1 hypothetical protein FHU33_4358 [Blastococcus colisei]
MPVRRPLVRLLCWTGALCGGVLAVVGGLGLQGPGLIAVGLAGLLAASTAVGLARDATGHGGRSLTESAVQAGAWTVGLLLALVGLAALAGGLVALLTGGIGAITWLAVHAARTSRRSATRPSSPTAGPTWPAAGVEVLLLPVPPPEAGTSSTAADRTSSVSGLPTPALGREWLRTSAALAGRLGPADRQALVRRRAETLDELERRNPAGFARWLADGPAPGSDPAAYVRGRSVHGDPTAESDAA